MIERLNPWLVLVFCVTLVAPALAVDHYGNATDIAAVRKAVPKSIPSAAGACAVHANRIVVVATYALVQTFYSDPCGAGADDLWGKRNGAWVKLAAGKPIMPPCVMHSKGVPDSTILQLVSRYAGPDYASRAQEGAQKELKACRH